MKILKLHPVRLFALIVAVAFVSGVVSGTIYGRAVAKAFVNPASVEASGK